MLSVEPLPTIQWYKFAVKRKSRLRVVAGRTVVADICCGGKISSKNLGRTCCCGTGSYNPTLNICCRLRIFSRANGKTRCYFRQTYNPNIYKCCTFPRPSLFHANVRCAICMDPDSEIEIGNNTWVRGNTRFISSVKHDVSRVSPANECGIMFNTRNKSAISKHTCIILFIIIINYSLL